MNRYIAFDSNTEVSGRAMYAFTSCLTAYEIEPILKKHEVNAIDINQWYPQQKWLDILTDISQNANASTNMVAVGMKIVENISFPSEIDTLLKAAFAIAQVYYGDHRNGYPGKQEVWKGEEGHIIYSLACPYPDDLFYGCLWSMTKRFLPLGHHFTVRYLNNTHYRKQEDVPCVVDISW